MVSIFFWNSVECPCLDTFENSEEKFSIRRVSPGALMKDSVVPGEWLLLSVGIETFRLKMQWDKNAFLKLFLGCNACPQFTDSISVWCSRAKEAFLPVCPRALDTHCDVYSSFCPLRIKSEVQRFPKLTLPFIAALGSVAYMDTCRVWEQKQLMLNTAYPSFWDQSSIYMSETCAASGGGDLKAAPWAGAVRGTPNPALSWSPWAWFWWSCAHPQPCHG